MVDIKTVAERAGVSVNTVSRVLNGSIKGVRSDALLRANRIRQIADELDYRPRASARMMRSERTHQIGLLLRNSPIKPLHNPAMYELILGVNQELEASGYLLVLVRIGDVHAAEGGGSQTGSRVFEERRLDGMIVLDSLPETTCRQVERLMDKCVFVHCNTHRPTRCLHRDERAAGRLAAEKALAAGYRRVLWIGPQGSEHYSAIDRPRGVEEALAAADRPPMERAETPVYIHMGDHIARALPGLDAETVVIAYDSHMALTLTRLAASAGLRPGKDFGLICCDESHEITMTYHNLARVSFDRFAMGRQTGSMILSLLNAESAEVPSVQVQGTWIEGDTAPGPA